MGEVSGVELFTVGTTAVTLADALAVAGTATAAVAALQQGQVASNEAKFRSDLARREAVIAKQQAERERIIARQNEEDFRRDQSRAMARRRAVLGVSGVDPSSGSPLLTSEDFAGEVELQARRLRSGGEARATRLEQTAGQSLAEGRFLRRAGREFRTGGALRGGSLLLSGLGRTFA